MLGDLATLLMFLKTILKQVPKRCFTWATSATKALQTPKLHHNDYHEWKWCSCQNVIKCDMFSISNVIKFIWQKANYQFSTHSNQFKLNFSWWAFDPPYYSDNFSRNACVIFIWNSRHEEAALMVCNSSTSSTACGNHLLVRQSFECPFAHASWKFTRIRCWAGTC